MQTQGRDWPSACQDLQWKSRTSSPATSDEAFSDLIDKWHADPRLVLGSPATQTWSFFDPAPEFADFNTLTEVSTGQIVTIIMSYPGRVPG